MPVNVVEQQNKNLEYCYDLTDIGDTGVHALIAKSKYNQVKFTRYDKDVIDLFRRSTYKVDYYLTINTFKHHHHSLDEIVGLKANFVDIDTELHGIENEQFKGFLDDIMDELDYCPKYVLSSGHGFYFVFPYEFQIRVNNNAMVTLWDLVEKEILHNLNNVLYSYFGVENICDSKSSDCSRALRMPGTKNRKNRTDIRECNVIKVNKIRSQYSLFTLVDELLPKYDKTKTNRYNKRHHGKINLKYNPMTLKVNRTNDLKKLVELRDYDLTGKRESFLYLFACNAGYYMSNDDTIEAIESLNASFTEPLSERELRSLKSEIEHLDLTQFKHKNRTLIKYLEINNDEQKQLKTIISTSEKRRRKNDHRSKVGRSKDIKSIYAKRRTQSGQSKRKKTFRNKKIIKLHDKGYASCQIVKLVNVSRSTVTRVLRARN